MLGTGVCQNQGKIYLDVRLFSALLYERFHKDMSPNEVSFEGDMLQLVVESGVSEFG